MKFINKYLRNLSPYKVASHRVWEVTDEQRNSILKLDWNEATVPPSPKVKERLQKLVENEDFYFLYPSTNNTELLDGLSTYCSLPIENIQYFASSDSLHEYLATMYINAGDPILILGPTYDNFRLTCEANGATIHYFNYDEQFNLNEDEFVNKIEKLNPSLVYICNPNNPSGTLISNFFLTKLISKFTDIIFLIDEAYYEFSGVTMAEHVVNHTNLFISRTFSKAFALANFRAGYLISDINNIKQISKIRNPKNISTFAQEAVIGVLSDIGFMANYVEEVNSTREWFINVMNQYSFVNRVFQSHANFILVEFKSNEVKTMVFYLLEQNNIYVRNLTHSKILMNSLRISIGTKAQMIRVNEVLKSLK